MLVKEIGSLRTEIMLKIIFYFEIHLQYRTRSDLYSVFTTAYGGYHYPLLLCCVITNCITYLSNGLLLGVRRLALIQHLIETAACYRISCWFFYIK